MRDKVHLVFYEPFKSTEHQRLFKHLTTLLTFLHKIRVNHSIENSRSSIFADFLVRHNFGWMTQDIKCVHITCDNQITHVQTLDIFIINSLYHTVCPGSSDPT